MSEDKRNLIPFIPQFLGGKMVIMFCFFNTECVGSESSVRSPLCPGCSKTGMASAAHWAVTAKAVALVKSTLSLKGRSPGFKCGC